MPHLSLNALLTAPTGQWWLPQQMRACVNYRPPNKDSIRTYHRFGKQLILWFPGYRMQVAAISSQRMMPKLTDNAPHKCLDFFRFDLFIGKEGLRRRTRQRFAFASKVVHKDKLPSLKAQCHRTSSPKDHQAGLGIPHHKHFFAIRLALMIIAQRFPQKPRNANSLM